MMDMPHAVMIRDKISIVLIAFDIVVSVEPVSFIFSLPISSMNSKYQLQPTSIMAVLKASDLDSVS